MNTCFEIDFVFAFIVSPLRSRTFAITAEYAVVKKSLQRKVQADKIYALPALLP